MLFLSIIYTNPQQILNIYKPLFVIIGYFFGFIDELDKPQRLSIIPKNWSNQKAGDTLNIGLIIDIALENWLLVDVVRNVNFFVPQ